uniref:Uncharacterized protein n=1 Tax=Oryza glumipatula TaxID=40148 RepID=A0A0D9YP55_9ORYZ
MSVLLLLLPSSLSLALSPPPPPPPFFPPQWAPPVAGGGGPFAGEDACRWNTFPLICSLVSDEKVEVDMEAEAEVVDPAGFTSLQYLSCTQHGVGYGSGPDGAHHPTVSSVHGNQYMPTKGKVDVECIIGQAAGHSKPS